MRRLMFLAALAALVVPAGAPAGAPAGTPAADNAAKACAAERAGMGVAAFRSLYGGTSSAFGKCVAKRTYVEVGNLASASRACRAERADATFAAAHSGQGFNQTYGANENDKNAFGKCVSLKAKAASQAQVRATIKAARSCKAARSADAAAFSGQYGSGKNALGKCISAASK